MSGLFGGGGGGAPAPIDYTRDPYDPSGMFKYIGNGLWENTGFGGDSSYVTDTPSGIAYRKPAAAPSTVLGGATAAPLAAPAPASAAAPAPAAAPAGPMPATLVGSLGEHPVAAPAPAATAASTAAVENPGAQATSEAGVAGPRRKRTARRGRGATLLGDSAVSEPEVLGGA